MQMGDVLPWILIVVLLVVAVALVLLRRRAEARWRRQLTDVETASAQRETELRSQHDAAESATRNAHSREKQQLDAEVSEAKTRAEHLRKFASRGIRHEASSRESILSVCEAAAVDAVLATNVVFLPTDVDREFFTAQIDHVLVTEWGCLIIESKNWDGVVFDGVNPTDIHASFGLLVERSQPVGAAPFEAPFAIQLAPSQNGPIKVRAYRKGDAPASQVRLQAKRLRNLIEARLDMRPYFNTCVYYSHPRAQVHAKRRDSGEFAYTQVVSTERQLRSVITGLRTPGRAKLQRQEVSRMANFFAALGADTIGTGSFESEWVSPLPRDRASAITSRTSA